MRSYETPVDYSTDYRDNNVVKHTVKVFKIFLTIDCAFQSFYKKLFDSNHIFE